MLVIFLFLLIASSQATDWSNVRPRVSEVDGFENWLDAPVERIINGTVTTPGQLPYQVGIVLDSVAFCGGSLIAPTVVLTAAHCIAGTIDFEVHLGAQNINEEEEEGRVIVATRDTLKHKDFDPISFTNDVGLIFLPEQVSGPNIKPIRLPSRSQVDNNFEGVTVRISGWGHPGDDIPSLTEELMYADTEVMSNDHCLAFYPGIIETCHMCFDTKFGTVGICTGDSGGPLVMTEDDGEVTLIGVTSFKSLESCQDGLPNGASRLTCHLDWLESNANIQIRP